MAPIKHKNQESSVFWWLIIPVMVDLFTTGSITWSRWAIFGFVIYYFADFFRDNASDETTINILKERYAKGEITEEEYLTKKAALESDSAKEKNSNSRLFIGGLLIGLGVIFIVKEFLFFHIDLPWMSMLLIGAGIFWIYRNR